MAIYRARVSGLSRTTPDGEPGFTLLVSTWDGDGPRDYFQHFGVVVRAKDIIEAGLDVPGLHPVVSGHAPQTANSDPEAAVWSALAMSGQPYIVAAIADGDVPLAEPRHTWHVAGDPSQVGQILRIQEVPRFTPHALLFVASTP